MQLAGNSWFVRLFFWSVRIWDSFTDQGLYWNMQKQTNLCFFVRVIVLWMPLALVANIAMWAMAFYVLVWMPIELFGVLNYLAFLAGAAVVVIFVFILDFIKSWWAGRHPKDDSSVPASVAFDSAEPYALDVFIEWVKAKKNKVCPIVTFHNKESAR